MIWNFCGRLLYQVYPDVFGRSVHGCVGAIFWRLNLCYTEDEMDFDHHIWRVWANYLHRWGLGAHVITVLDALGPLTLVGAQLVYIGQPVLGTFIPDKHIKAFARLLEEPGQAQAFATFLQKRV